MRESWLKANQRAYAVALAPALGLFTLGLMLVGIASLVRSNWLFWPGLVVGAVGGLFILWIVIAMRVPRLAFEQGELLVYLRGLTPLRVPIEHVEVFFHGQGPAMLNAQDDNVTTTSNIIVRISDAGKDWHRRTVRSELGTWCDGYIVIRGTWCEPLSMQRLKDLNAKLLNVHREMRERAAQADA